MMERRWAARVRMIALVGAAVTWACDPAATQAPAVSASLPASRTIGLPEDLGYASLGWIKTDTIVIEAGPRGPVGSMGLVALDPVVGSLQPLRVEPENGCRLQQPGLPSRLPDGRLGYVVYCLAESGPDRFTMFARSLTDATPTRLAELGGYNPTGVSFAPDLDQAIFGHSSAICAGVAFAGLMGVIPLPPTTAGSGSSSFRVDQALTSDRCDETGRANDPVWSPDGKRIALLVSPPLDGVGGLDRVDLPWEVDVVNSSGNPNLTTLLAGLVRPSGLDWSPDGRWLVFSGRLGDQPGTYIVQIGDRRVVRIFDQILAGPVWSPDGQSIAGLLPSQQALTGGSAVVVDLGSQVQ